MNEQRLRDLLDDLVEDLPGPRLASAETAWRAAERRRPRWVPITAAAGATAAVLAAAVAIASPWGVAPPVSEPPAAQSLAVTPRTLSPSAARPLSVDTTYAGAPLRWAPPVKDEPTLARLQSVLPEQIDLSSGRPTLEVGEPVLAVVAVLDPTMVPKRFVVLKRNGKTYDLPANSIRTNHDRDGNGAALLPPNGGLAPDGWHVFFAQPSSIEVYAFQTGKWSTIDTDNWVAERARWLDNGTIWVPQSSGAHGTTYTTEGQLIDSAVDPQVPSLALKPGDVPFGPWADLPGVVAGGYFLEGSVDGPIANPQAVIARRSGDPYVLAIDYDGRSKGCCQVVGWISEDVVAFSSGMRILAWRVGTGEMYRIGEITGLQPGREFYGSISWAWRALR